MGAVLGCVERWAGRRPEDRTEGVGPWAGPDQIRIALLSQIIGVVEVINHGLIAV